jgi:hypothetical protein
MLALVQGIKVAAKRNLHGYGGEGKNVDSTLSATMSRYDKELEIQPESPMPCMSIAGASSTATMQCGRELDVSNKALQKDVSHASIMDEDTKKTNERSDNIVGITELGSSVETDQEWIQSISELTFGKTRNYFISGLKRMWIQEELHGVINILKGDL